MSEELGDDVLAEMALICASRGVLIGIDVLDALRNCVVRYVTEGLDPKPDDVERQH